MRFLDRPIGASAGFELGAAGIPDWASGFGVGAAAAPDGATAAPGRSRPQGVPAN
jgi:hypothetical protein